MSSPSTPAKILFDNEIVPDSPLVTPPRSPRFMPISAGRVAEIEFSEEFDSSEDEPETIEEKSEHAENKSQPAATLHDPIEIWDEVTALHLRLEQDEQRITELEQQIATVKNGKRKWEENFGENSGQQQRKRQKTVNVYTAGPDVRKRYKGKKPHCNKCNRHHTGHCGIYCGKCKKYGHQTKNCRSTTPTVKLAATLKASGACYECGGIGHYRMDCANLKNMNNKNNRTGDKD